MPQHAVGALQALLDQERGKRLAVGLEQALEVARRDAELLRNGRNRQVLSPAIVGDEEFCFS
ncbi:hypothetical protein V1280_000280 [Bradyrhizobium sp. AZCC 2230]